MSEDMQDQDMGAELALGILRAYISRLQIEIGVGENAAGSATIEAVRRLRSAAAREPHLENELEQLRRRVLQLESDLQRAQACLDGAFL